MNQATEVWGFVGGRGLASEVDRLVDEERELVPDFEPAVLLRRFPEVQTEIADRLGDFDLDPNDAGIVRRIGVRVLDIAHPERAFEPVNPARNSAAEDWRSARIYLVAVDTPVQLDFWRQQASQLDEPSVYLAFPREEVHLDGHALRELIAVMKALDKAPADGHAHEVLDSKYTRLRTELRDQFEQAFGNEGLRGGTVVVPAGKLDAPVPVDSWNRLLPAVAEHLESRFPDQIRVRCGSFNEWKSGVIGSAISKVAKRILKFDQSGDFRAEYLGFNRTSQEAAVVDGVLVENGLLTQAPLQGKPESAGYRGPVGECHCGHGEASWQLVLADGLIGIMQEDASTHDELVGTTTTNSYPDIERVWQDLRGKIDRYLEGVKAPVRTAIRSALGAAPEAEESENKTDLSAVVRSASEVIGGTENPLSQIADRLEDDSPEDTVVSLTAAVSGKTPTALTDEDFGRAAGIMEVASALAKQQSEQRSGGVCRSPASLTGRNQRLAG